MIVLRAGVGDTLQQGAPVADLHGGEVADTAVLGGLVTGPERTFYQDPLFAFRLLADIGLRALSPAVNDPATAVQVLDTIESLLQALVSRDLDVADVADDAGTVRVVLALPSWDDYLRTGLDDLIESAVPVSHGPAAGTGPAHHPAERGATGAPAADHPAAPARRAAWRRQFLGDLA